jgi:hypothetical protein
LPHLQPENRKLSGRNFRQHHFVGKLNQLPNDELEKFLHRLRDYSLGVVAAAVSGGSAGCGLTSVVAATAGRFLVFLIKLFTVSDGRAPRAIQYSARSNFKVLLSPGFFGS